MKLTFPGFLVHFFASKIYRWGEKGHQFRKESYTKTFLMQLGQLLYTQVFYEYFETIHWPMYNITQIKKYEHFPVYILSMK